VSSSRSGEIISRKVRINVRLRQDKQLLFARVEEIILLGQVEVTIFLPYTSLEMEYVLEKQILGVKKGSVKVGLVNLA